MCGIAGMVWQRPVEGFGAIGADLLGRLGRRGPDDQGWIAWHDGETRGGRGRPDDALKRVLLLHRRLSILDLSDAGRQPMATPDGRFHIVFNGEIYNYLELRDELRSGGFRFSTGTDTEVLLAGFSQWGRGVLPRLVGMFAFAVLDARERRLFLARDCFGIKPLFYARIDGGLAFGSQIDALLGLPGVDRQADAQQLWTYLRLGVTDADGGTLFRSIRHLPPAHHMTIDLDAPALAEPTRYWRLDPTPRDDLSFEAAASTLRDLFLDSIKLHLRSDVPVGVALSGGVDSSAIASAVRHVAGDGLQLDTFTHVADDDRLNERQWADRVGRSVGANMHYVEPRSAELIDDLDDLILAQGEPFSGTSMYAQYRVFRLAHQNGMKVMLDGQGSDEMLGGYLTYHGARLATLIRHGRLLAAWKYARRASRRPGIGGRKMMTWAAAFLAPRALLGVGRRCVGQPLYPAWMNGPWFDERGVQPHPPEAVRAPDQLRRYLIETVTRTSLPMLLRFEDRSSMAHSIESRVPFLTPALAEFVLSLPESYLIAPDGTTKAVFRRAMRGLVPDAVLDRQDKIGFATPEPAWLNQLLPWAQGLIDSDTARSIPAIQHGELIRHWDRWRREPPPYDFQAWRWLNVIRWAQLYSVRW